MKKASMAVAAAIVLIAGGAPSAQAYTGPCETQRELFEQYNIQSGVESPEAAYAYNTACGITG